MVVREAEYRAVLDVLNQLVSGAGGVRLAFSPVQIPENEDWGTADSLRHLRGKLKVSVIIECILKLFSLFQPQHSDVLVVSCDLVTTVPLHLLTEFHSCHHSTLTCLLSQPPWLQEDMQRKASSAAGELVVDCSLESCDFFVVECDIIGLALGQQLVYFSAQADLDDCLSLSKAFLKRYAPAACASGLASIVL